MTQNPKPAAGVSGSRAPLLDPKLKASLLMHLIGHPKNGGKSEPGGEQGAGAISIDRVSDTVLHGLLAELKSAFAEKANRKTAPNPPPRDGGQDARQTPQSSSVLPVGKAREAAPSHACDPKGLATRLANEHPAFAALIIRGLDTKMAGDVLRAMRPAAAQKVALNLTRVPEIAGTSDTRLRSACARFMRAG